jgi:hypothetical protein
MTLRQCLKIVGAALAQNRLRQQGKNPTHGVLIGAAGNAPLCVGAALAPLHPRAYSITAALRQQRSAFGDARKRTLRLPRIGSKAKRTATRSQERRTGQYHHDFNLRVTLPSCQPSPWSESTPKSNYRAAPTASPWMHSNRYGCAVPVMAHVGWCLSRAMEAQAFPSEAAHRWKSISPVYETGCPCAISPCKSVICLRSTGILMRTGSDQVADQGLARAMTRCRPLVPRTRSRRPPGGKIGHRWSRW